MTEPRACAFAAPTRPGTRRTAAAPARFGRSRPGQCSARLRRRRTTRVVHWLALGAVSAPSSRPTRCSWHSKRSARAIPRPRLRGCLHAGAARPIAITPRHGTTRWQLAGRRIEPSVSATRAEPIATRSVRVHRPHSSDAGTCLWRLRARRGSHRPRVVRGGNGDCASASAARPGRPHICRQRCRTIHVTTAQRWSGCRTGIFANGDRR